MTRYLLDTNVLSEPLRKTPDRLVMRQLQRHEHQLCTASIAWHELWFGAARLPLSARRAAIERYLLEVVGVELELLPYDAVAARWHAHERARLEAAGLTPPFVDGQIAAIAAVHGLTLVTRNVTDFERYADIKVESWFG